VLSKEEILLHPPRLEAVERVWDADHLEHEFDRLARLAAKSLRAPTSLITLIGATAQRFRGICGGSEAMMETRGGPHENSLCRHTVVKGSLVAVSNASADPEFRNNPIVLANGIEAYLSIPLVNDDGQILGTICGIDYVAREWTSDEIDSLRDHAAVAIGQLEAIAMNQRMRMAMDVALHDLKTPLSGLTMASSLVEEKLELIPSSLHPLMEVVRSSTEAATKLVATLSASQRHEKHSPCDDVVAVINSVVARLSPPAKRKDITLLQTSTHTSDLDIPRWVIEQILENLITNAVKFSPRGSCVTVEFSITGNEAIFEVLDEGPGFTASDMSRMFNRYVRLSALPTGGEASTGLGLSIVKRLALQHGGSVELVSRPEESARFQVIFETGR